MTGLGQLRYGYGNLKIRKPEPLPLFHIKESEHILVQAL